MKKMIVSLTLILIFSAGRIQAQDDPNKSTTTTTTTTKYYYYPSQNVYYNEATQEYSYYDKPSLKWTTVKTLPSTYTTDNADRVELSYNGADIWKDNSTHITKYKKKRSGKVKMKTAD